MTAIEPVGNYAVRLIFDDGHSTYFKFADGEKASIVRVDESGKGDFFGPLVIAGVYVEREIARRFLALGVTDSKRIGSDKKIRQLADEIRNTPAVAVSVVLS